MILKKVSTVYAIFFISSLSLASPLIPEPSAMLEALKKDGIALTNYTKFSQPNPLIRAITPKNLRNSSITEYEYHAWSEANEEGIYPIYQWEKVSESEFYNNYELAKYKSDAPIDTENFFSELDKKQKETLLTNLDSGVILGALTQKQLARSDKKDSEVFLLIASAPLSPKVEEKLIPSFPPPSTTNTQSPDPSNVVVSPAGDPEPFGVPVPGKPGFVYSPFRDGNGISGTEKKQIIDVKGYTPGTKVRDPYTQKVIRVP